MNFKTISKENFISKIRLAGFLLVPFLSCCSTLRDSLILGAGSGAALGGLAGGQVPGAHDENTIKGAVIGGVVGGLASYVIHGSLESRDAKVRRDTLLNLEKYDVLGRDALMEPAKNKTRGKDSCFATREVDGRLVSIPCRYLEGSGEAGERNQ